MSRALVVASLLVAIGHPALAEPDAAQAESLFREGRRLMDENKLDEACAAFEASQRASPAVTTQLNLAGCREKNHQLATAWGLFVDVERALRGSTDVTSAALLNAAHTHAAALEPKLSKLTIRVGDAPVAGLQVLRGSEPVDPGAWNRELPSDGGTIRIVARAPGYVEWSTTIVVAPESDTKSVDVPALALAPAPPPTVTAPPPKSHTVPIALGVAAVALGGTAIGFELWAEHTYDKSKIDPSTSSQLSTWHTANRERYVAEGLGIAGIGCAAAAIVLLVRHGPEDHHGVAIAPLVTPAAFGIAANAIW